MESEEGKSKHSGRAATGSQSISHIQLGTTASSTQVQSNCHDHYSRRDGWSYRVPVPGCTTYCDSLCNLAMQQKCMASSGTGVYLDKDKLTAERVRRSLETVASPRYKKTAEKLRKIFIQAGGTEKAAELVEFYEEVGYEHLHDSSLCQVQLELGTVLQRRRIHRHYSNCHYYWFHRIQVLFLCLS